MGRADQDFLRRNTGFFSSYLLGLVTQNSWDHAIIDNYYDDNLAFAGKSNGT